MPFHSSTEIDTSYFTCTLGQAASYKTEAFDFTNINNLISANDFRYGSNPAVGFPIPSSDPTAQWTHKIFSFTEVHHASCATADIISEHINIRDRQTVALLCPSTADFLLTWLALMNLGHPVLLIAPQCSPTAVAELCKQCEADVMLYDEMYADLARKAASEGSIDIRHLPSTGEIDPSDFLKRSCGCTGSDIASKDDIAYLHHTSGTSSGIPKPIPQSHNAGAGVYARFDGSEHATFTTTPLYHGGIADLFRAWTSGALIWLFPGKDVPITSGHIVKCLQTAELAGTPSIVYFSSVPYVLQMMAEDEKGLKMLRQMHVVGVGGAALPMEVGDSLVNQEVNIVSRFGSAECGFLMSSDRKYDEDKAWQYLRLGKGSRFLRFEEREGNLHELIILAGWPHISKTNREDGSFATSDLFEPHPTIPHAWRYSSRADSQLTLITGKKFDPAPLEDSIAASSPTLQDVLIFGSGKAYPGALLFRSKKACDIKDQDMLELIAPVVQKLNEGSQTHAQIPRNMLIAMPHNDGALEKSSKGTVLRRKAESRYSAEIALAYSAQSSVRGYIDDDEIEYAVLEMIRSIVGPSSCQKRDVELDTDLFTYGIDSVACLQIRHAVSKLLPDNQVDLPLTIVQDCGSARKLSRNVKKLRRGQDVGPQEDTTEEQLQVMQKLVNEYSQLSPGDANISNDSPLTSPGRRGKVVLLTGATGSLGTHLLSQLIATTTVSRIHLLLRGANRKAAEDRVRQIFFAKKLPVTPDFDIKVTFHTCSLAEPQLGLASDAYRTLSREVDVIFHLAWSVDFLLPLQGFQRHFTGLQSLLNLGLTHAQYSGGTATRLIFCSSTAAVSSFSDGAIPEDVVQNREVSGHFGYSRSKWVAENICLNASMSYPELNSCISIVRVGQLSGDRIKGVWNKSEAYPLMLSSAKLTGCLPDLHDEDVGWLPVDIAATSFVQLGTGEENIETDVIIEQPAGVVKVYHVLNPDRTTTWPMLLKWLQRLHHFHVVSTSEWLNKLEGISKHAHELETTHPSLKLLGFWQKAYGGGVKQESGSGNQIRELGNFPKPNERAIYKLERSLAAMPVLADVKAVDEEYAGKLWSWIDDNV